MFLTSLFLFEKTSENNIFRINVAFAYRFGDFQGWASFQRFSLTFLKCLARRSLPKVPTMKRIV